MPLNVKSSAVFLRCVRDTFPALFLAGCMRSDDKTSGIRQQIQLYHTELSCARVGFVHLCPFTFHLDQA